MVEPVQNDGVVVDSGGWTELPFPCDILFGRIYAVNPRTENQLGAGIRVAVSAADDAEEVRDRSLAAIRFVMPS